MFLPYEGVELAYEERGSGEPLLLIHGTGCQTATWGRTFDDLAAAGHRVIAYDRRGYGASAHPPVRDYRRHVADAAAVLERVAKTPATVVGWSSGGNVALALAATRPDLVRRLIVAEAALHGVRHLMATTLGMLTHAKWHQLRGRRQEAAVGFFRWIFEEGYDALSQEERDALLSQAGPVLAELDLHPYGIMTEYLSLARVRRIPVPITFLIGDSTAPFFRRLHRHLVRAVPSIRTEVIPGASHFVHRDAPNAFVAAVQRAVSDPDGLPRPALPVTSAQMSMELPTSRH
jgi:pimeloyl-ACP methyl ester carboxylesterase